MHKEYNSILKITLQKANSPNMFFFQSQGKECEVLFAKDYILFKVEFKAFCEICIVMYDLTKMRKSIDKMTDCGDIQSQP